MRRSLGVYYLSVKHQLIMQRTVQSQIKAVTCTSPFHVDSSVSLTVRRSRVLNTVALALRAWSQAFLEVLHGQVSSKAESCNPPSLVEVG